MGAALPGFDTGETREPQRMFSLTHSGARGHDSINCRFNRLKRSAKSGAPQKDRRCTCEAPPRQMTVSYRLEGYLTLTRAARFIWRPTENYSNLQGTPVDEGRHDCGSEGSTFVSRQRTRRLTELGPDSRSQRGRCVDNIIAAGSSVRGSYRYRREIFRDTITIPVSQHNSRPNRDNEWAAYSTTGGRSTPGDPQSGAQYEVLRRAAQRRPSLDSKSIRCWTSLPEQVRNGRVLVATTAQSARMGTGPGKFAPRWA